jgi:hypothetical protein
MRKSAAKATVLAAAAEGRGFAIEGGDGGEGWGEGRAAVENERRLQILDPQRCLRNGLPLGAWSRAILATVLSGIHVLTTKFT